MKNTREINGLRCELAGLLIILLATIWQAAFTDWFDKNSRDWVNYIQEEVNIAILASLNDLSRQMNSTNEAERKNIRLEIYERTSQSIFKAINERDRRAALDKSQATVFSIIRYSLFAIGALLIILGKLLVLLHKRANPVIEPTT